MSFGRKLALSALSGALLASAFPKPSLAIAGFVALVPLLVALGDVNARRGFILGQVTGAVQGVLLLSWVADVLTRFGGANIFLAFLLVFLLSLAFGLFLGAFGALQAHLGRAFGPRATLFAPFLYVACEFLREHLLFGFPWCLLGYSQVDFPELVQIASVTAVHGVTFLLVSASAGIAHAVLSSPGPARRFGLTVPAILISLAMAFGHARLQRPLGSGASIQVGVVQASIPQDQKWASGLLQANIDKHLRLTERAVEQGARLVAWPESAIGYELDLYPETRKQILDFAAQEGIFLLAGNDDRGPDISGEPRSYVGAKLIAPDPRIAMRYHKIRLVPFGEYFPLPQSLASFLPIERLVESVSDFTPGLVPTTARVQGASIGAFICYEAIFPSLVRRFPLRGAEILFNLTNDGWYGTSAAPYQHYAMTRFRAIENRRFLVRAANTGISAIIDPYGREIAKTELMEARALVGEVRGISELTLYARYGDVFAWSNVAVAALLTLAAALVRARASNKLQASPAHAALRTDTETK